MTSMNAIADFAEYKQLNIKTMIYQQLFKQSGLSNTEICNRLEFSHTQRLQYQRATKFNIEQYVAFGKKLGLTDKDLTELVIERIKDLLK